MTDRTPRVACLVPAATDLAARLGLHIVGVSHACDHPAARGLPVLTRSRVPETQSGGTGAADVDAAVREAVAAGGPLYEVDRVQLAALAPDIVLSQAICEVCAARADECDLPANATLIELTATTIGGLYEDIRAVAAAADVGMRGEQCVVQLATDLAAIVQAAGRPRVLTLEWGDPAFLGGHWVPELVAVAGGEDLLASTGERSRVATWPEIAASEPDVVVFMPCGYTLAAALAEARTLHPAIRGLRCVQAGELWATDAGRLFSRCTPASVVAGAAALASLLRGVELPGTACRVPGAAHHVMPLSG